MTHSSFVKKISVYLYIFIMTCTTQTHALSEYDTKQIEDQNISHTCDCTFCDEINAIKQETKRKKSHKKNWTIIIYIAADNDLRSFAARNIKQMATIGSNEYFNILVHLDIKISGKKITRRYLIEKDRILHINPYGTEMQPMDSGDPATLISCCEWGITNFPADEYALILWDHATGILDPKNYGKIFRPADLFSFNPATNRFDVNRSISFIDFISSAIPDQRGICWDDTTGNYLSNRQLESTLQIICQNYLNGKKFGIIGFDACLMSMVEVASFIKDYAHIMVSSQEVELGIGWNYAHVFAPFTTSTLDKEALAQQIVSAYHQTFSLITYDYTLSAINLDSMGSLEKNINSIAKLLIEALYNQNGTSVIQAIRTSRNKLVCTYFDEPSYIDLHHFYTNLSANLKAFKLLDVQHEIVIKNALSNALDEGKKLIEKIVLANTVGRNLKNARGLSIYFPERVMHFSYKEASFSANNTWGEFLRCYLLC